MSQRTRPSLLPLLPWRRGPGRGGHLLVSYRSLAESKRRLDEHEASERVRVFSLSSPGGEGRGEEAVFSRRRRPFFRHPLKPQSSLTPCHRSRPTAFWVAGPNIS